MTQFLIPAALVVVILFVIRFVRRANSASIQKTSADLADQNNNAINSSGAPFVDSSIPAHLSTATHDTHSPHHSEVDYIDSPISLGTETESNLNIETAADSSSSFDSGFSGSDSSDGGDA